MFEVAIALLVEGRRVAVRTAQEKLADADFERIGPRECNWRDAIIRAGVERYRYDDGEEVSRDKVWHPGAVGILAVDDRTSG